MLFRSIIIAYSAVIITGITGVMFLTVKFINIRMPYRVNPVSPKSVYSLIKSFCDFIAYYLNSGLTEMSRFMLEIVAAYFAFILIAAVVYIVGKCYNLTKGGELTITPDVELSSTANDATMSLNQ